MAAIHMNENEFQQKMNQGNWVLVDYWAPWCGYCRRIGPAYDKVAQDWENDVIVAKINIDEEPQLAHREMIEVIPTLVLYHEGKAVGSMVAPQSKAAIDEFLREKMG